MQVVSVDVMSLIERGVGGGGGFMLTTRYI